MSRFARDGRNLDKYREKYPLIILGTMYNQVNTEKNPTKKLSQKTMQMLSVLEDEQDETNSLSFLKAFRAQVWHDPAIRLNKTDSGMIGKPVRIEHGRTSMDNVGRILKVYNLKMKPGEVHAASEDDENALFVMAEITDKKTINEICDGLYSGFSVAYKYNIEGDTVVSKEFNEVSLVKRPFFKGCNLEVLASDEISPPLGDEDILPSFLRSEKELKSTPKSYWKDCSIELSTTLVKSTSMTTEAPKQIPDSAPQHTNATDDASQDHHGLSNLLKEMGNDPVKMASVIRELSSQVQNRDEALTKKQKELKALQDTYKSQNAEVYSKSSSAIKDALGLKEGDKLPSDVEKMLNHAYTADGKHFFTILNHLGKASDGMKEAEQLKTQMATMQKKLDEIEKGKGKGKRAAPDDTPSERPAKSQKMSSAFDSSTSYTRGPKVPEVAASDDMEEDDRPAFLTTEQRSRMADGKPMNDPDPVYAQIRRSLMKNSSGTVSASEPMPAFRTGTKLAELLAKQTMVKPSTTEDQLPWGS